MRSFRKNSNVQTWKCGEESACCHQEEQVSFNPLSPKTNMNILLTEFLIILWYMLGEPVQSSEHSIFGDHFVYSHEFEIDSISNSARRSYMLIIVGG